MGVFFVPCCVGVDTRSYTKPSIKMRAPKLFLVQYTDENGDRVVASYATMALAEAAAITAQAATPSNHGVYIYRLGVTAPERKRVGTDDAI
jgi:hypothetical protein